MDHHFSKTQYFMGCSCTLVYAGLVAAAYFDISTCPYVYDRPATTAPLRMPNTTEACDDVANIRRSLLASLLSADGFSCHMVDIIVWAYVIGLIVFMSYKYVTYRLQGLHYFFLDYCYFHNAVLLLFLLWRLVDVEWSEQPIVSWASHLPSWGWPNHSGVAGAANASTPHRANAAEELQWRHPILTGTPLGGDSFARRIVPSTARSFRLDGIYLPVSVDILTCGYVVAHLTEAEVLSSFVLFFSLLAGSFGPILGAIVMWKNALLFHSFDRMSSCYLHLAPGIVQGLLLHRLFISARREIESVDAEQLYAQITNFAVQMQIPVGNLLPSMQVILLNQTAAVASATKAASASRGPARLLSSLLSSLSLKQQQQQFSQYAASHRLEALCGYGTLCYDLRRAVTFGNLLRLHFLMFCVWQLFYHTFNEWRRHAREKAWKKRMAKLEREQAEFMQLTGATETEAELLRPSMVLSEGAGGNPAERVTSYTWMMAHPPGGPNGVLARFVLLFGKGRLPTTIMFQVTQWLLHTVFFTCSYPVIYMCFHYSLSAWPLLAWVLLFVCVCVHNAACVDQKWIAKLQQMASKGMEAERQDQLTKSMIAAAAAAASAKKTQ